MKYFQLILLCFICIVKSHGQVVVEITKEKHPTGIYAKVELKSIFPGGDSAWVGYAIAYNNIYICVSGQAMMTVDSKSQIR